MKIDLPETLKQLGLPLGLDATFVVLLRSATCSVWLDCHQPAYRPILANDLLGMPDTIPTNWFGYTR